MTKAHRHLVPTDEEPRPTYTSPGHDYERQVACMKELRALSSQIGAAYRARDELLHALALSRSLSRRDMATATGLNKSRVDQIIKEMAEEHQRRENAAQPNESTATFPTDARALALWARLRQARLSSLGGQSAP